MSGETTTGRFYGVGIGPGDPELITLKAARLIRDADVIAYHAGAGKQSLARSIAADLIPEGAIEEELRYPVTTGFTDHPRGYYGALADFYDECCDRLEAHLAAGRSVVVLAIGDPLFFGSFMYVHDRLSPRYPTEVVPGITSLSAATAAVATGLAQSALDVAARYATEREQFGRAIASNQGLAFLLADMEAAVTSARATYLHAARLRDAGRAFGKEAAVAKLVATDAAMRVTTDAIQVLGGAGFTQDFPVERYFREAKVTQIFEGTNQIQRLVISRQLLAGF